MSKLILFLAVGFIGTYIDVVLSALISVASKINWSLVFVIAITLAVLSPFISERLKTIQKRI